ncbi:hypothetical protein H2200_002846 [Cladophialophora chaetospira]|uniref:Sterigmatocystin biosynthesis monooxygenase stcW n=1 Tax=Cladophialophora chaetospira TaxID=386627 RepID=A0AA39CLQ9_9EURO|nr:hypothetical protein H2200_002846 [Cladophialophora chaetospira]
MVRDLGYSVEPHWHSQRRSIRIVCVGAGAAGLLVAYKLKKTFKDYELVCYEKNSGVGGTWFENRYPGCACDIPAHSYTYSFEPNPDWSTFYAYAPEIRTYFERFASKYDLHPFIKLNSRVQSAVWKEEKGISVDYADKNVAVIGTGSSAIQIIPQIQKTAKKVTAFMRSVTWISPVVGGNILEETKQQSSDESQKENPQAQYWYTDEEKQKFREDPKALFDYRYKLESGFNARFDMFIQDSDTSKMVQTLFREEMHRRIGPGHEELKEKLIPTWAPGCRRLTPGDGYLEALVKDNVEPIHNEITKIVDKGLIDDTGRLHEVDVLVCATGFNLAFAPRFEVLGVDSVSMATEFDPEPHVYLAVTVPKFPNYFVINGVRGNWANGSALPSHEVQVEYILQCVKRMQDENIRALEVKMEPVKQLYEHIDAWHLGSVWNLDCKSWYKNNIPGGKLWIWAGSNLHYMKTMKVVRWEHYNFRYFNDNMWSFLGNGRVEAEIKQDSTRLAPYTRQADVPWTID